MRTVIQKLLNKSYNITCFLSVIVESIMFKVPDWEDDIPDSKIKIIKTAPKKRNKLKKTLSSEKQNGVSKRSLKTKNTFKVNSRKELINNVKKSKLKLNNSPTPNMEENDRQTTEETIFMEVETDQEEKTINKKKSLKKRLKNKKKNSNDNIKLKNYDTDKLDELILIEKKKQLNKFKNDDIEKMLFDDNSEEKPSFVSPQNKKEQKKELIKSLLQKETHRNHINISNGNPLRERMLERLKAAKFRFLNEKLYTSTGSDAQKLFQADPTAFQTYHEGYQQQMKKWPVKPLDVIIKRIQKMPKSYKIADMGCGEAELSRRVSQEVRSFDLVAHTDSVEQCDIAHTPLPAGTLDVAVYCLALMGTDLTQYLLEANRVLRIGGHLLIAEVESRFHKVDDFIRDVQKLGFSHKKLDETHKVFFFMEFTKIREPPVKKAKLPILKLKPCIYKRR